MYATGDHIGSSRELTDAPGSIKARYDYDPYGRRAIVTGSYDAPHDYTGHLSRNGGTFVSTLYRSYAADLGRWISEDPIRWEEGPNLYAYVNNSPLDSVDPFGLRPTSPVVLRPGCTQVDATLIGERVDKALQWDWVLKETRMGQWGWAGDDGPIRFSACACVYKLAGILEVTQKKYIWLVQLECNSPCRRDYTTAETFGERKVRNVPSIGANPAIRTKPGYVVGNRCMCPL